MQREYHRWHSPALGREMEILVFGHSGARLLIFPTSHGKFYEWEDRGMIGCLGEHLHQGWLQIFCVDSIDTETWLAEQLHPVDRARRHACYDRYLVSEVIPFIHHKSSAPFLITLGSSLGGYHSINFAMRHPHLVQRAISFSGLQDIRRLTHGHLEEEIYFHNPVSFLPDDHSPERLASLRQMDIILAVGRDDGLIATNEHLSTVLWQKDIWHALRIWDGFAHDWPVWQKMLHLYIAGHD